MFSVKYSLCKKCQLPVHGPKPCIQAAKGYIYQLVKGYALLQMSMRDEKLQYALSRLDFALTPKVTSRPIHKQTHKGKKAKKK